MNEVNGGDTEGMQPLITELPEVDVATLIDDLPGHLDQLLTGAGAIVIRQAFDADTIAEARALIMDYSSVDADKVTHFQGQNTDKLDLQRRVWNLVNKGEVFERMVQHPDIMTIVEAFLGNECILGSLAANRLLPGGPGQEPHIDYPYWDLYKRDSFPMNINSTVPLNCQVTILLDDFTAENGATAMLPTSQRELVYPNDPELFAANAIRQTGRAGDVVIFNGMCWHCAMPNNSDADRTGVLIEYLPKFIVPLEDQRRGVRQEVVDRSSPRLKRLLGHVYPYPQLLDEADAGNAEGKY